MTTSLAAALAAMGLGHLEPRAEDISDMCPPSSEALEQTTTAIWSDLFATLQNTPFERDIEEMGWGLVNLFHRAAAKKHATIDRLTDEIRLLIAEQDGSEINTSNIEDKIDLAKKIEEAASCYEVNLVILAGNVGATPETRSTQGGTKITQFSLATSRPKHDSEGKIMENSDNRRVDDTEWHRITCFNGVGKTVAQYVDKGQKVMVRGRIHYTR